jgi:hypothetical protein
MTITASAAISDAMAHLDAETVGPTSTTTARGSAGTSRPAGRPMRRRATTPPLTSVCHRPRPSGMTPVQLRRLSADALAAAEWLEAQV